MRLLRPLTRLTEFHCSTWRLLEATGRSFIRPTSIPPAYRTYSSGDQAVQTRKPEFLSRYTAIRSAINEYKELEAENEDQIAPSGDDDAAQQPSKENKTIEVAQVYIDAFSDKLCARLFATEAFSPSFVLQALSAFGQASIGPLALQSLGRRCRILIQEYSESPRDPYETLASEIAFYLDQITQYDLVVQTHKYCRLIQSLASKRYGKILDTVFLSDMDPGVYGDLTLQKKLLYRAIHSGNLAEANQFLETVTLDSKKQSYEAWNTLFRAHMRDPDPNKWAKISQFLDQMLAHGISVSPNSIARSYLVLLRPRQRSKLPVSHYYADGFNDLEFLTNMWIKIVNNRPNTYIGYACWGEIIKRYGMLGRYNALERLIDWLCATYSKRNSALLQKIFPPQRQTAIVEWYFKSLALPPEDPNLISLNVNKSSLSHIEKWARGLAIVQRLSQYGVKVDTWRIRRICQIRLSILFEDRGGVISGKQANRYAQAFNALPLNHMVRYLQNLWQPQGTLFPVPSELLEDNDEDAKRLLKQVINSIPDRNVTEEQGPVLDSFLLHNPQEKPLELQLQSYVEKRRDGDDAGDDPRQEPLPFLRKTPILYSRNSKPKYHRS